MSPKKIKNYKDFRNEELNEEFIGSLLSAAKGAFKNFLTGLAAPFKTLKDESANRIMVRLIDTKSQTYQVGYEYMTRLKKADFQREINNRGLPLHGFVP